MTESKFHVYGPCPYCGHKTFWDLMFAEKVPEKWHHKFPINLVDIEHESLEVADLVRDAFCDGCETCSRDSHITVYRNLEDTRYDIIAVVDHEPYVFPRVIKVLLRMYQDMMWPIIHSSDVEMADDNEFEDHIIYLLTGENNVR